jgi:hypothetical protein
VIGQPPSFAGASQPTVASPSPGVALTPVGGPGTVVAGVTVFDGVEAGPLPTAFAALTVKV